MLGIVVGVANLENPMNDVMYVLCMYARNKYTQP